MTDKATPRPWDIYELDPDNWGVAEIGKSAHGIFGSKTDAAFTVRAVNSYDESRALLKEAAGWIETLDEDAFGYIENDDHEVPTCWPVKRELLARITAHLEAKND